MDVLILAAGLLGAVVVQDNLLLCPAAFTEVSGVIDEGPIEPTAVKPSIRQITVELVARGGDRVCYGSGTVIGTGRGRASVLTARHMFPTKGMSVDVIDPGGSKSVGSVVSVSPVTDLALVDAPIPASVLASMRTLGRDPAKPFKIRFAPAAGEVVQMVGYGPGDHKLVGQDGTRIKGPFEVTSGEVKTVGHYAYSMNPREGDSGGGCWNGEGLVGVVTHQTRQGPHEGIIVGPEAVKTFLAECCSPAYVQTGLSIDAPGIRIRRGPFVNLWGGDQLERYRYGPFGWRSYVRRGGFGSGSIQSFQSGFDGDFSSTSIGGQVLGGCPGGVCYPSAILGYRSAPSFVSYATQTIPYYIQTAPAQVYAAPQAPSPQVYGSDLNARVTALEQALARGITFVTRNADGTESRASVPIGGAIGVGNPVQFYQPQP